MNERTPIARTVQGYPARTADFVPRRVQGIQYLAAWKNDPLHPHAWLCKLIGTLFQSFVTAVLPGAPAAEMLPATAQLWVDVLVDMNLTEEDAERVQAAGRKLLRDLEDWPQVKALIEAMPRRQGPGTRDRGTVTADAGMTDADREAGKKALAELKEMFR